MASSNSTQKTHERWIERYARCGYAAKGIIYGSAGLLALFEVFGLSKDETVVGATGVIREIAAQPFGLVLSILLAISLMGYVIWRFIQAFLDPEHNSSCNITDIVRRLGYACSGLVYASIAYSVIEILTEEAQEGDRTADDWALIVMNQPMGRLLVGAAGLVFFFIGCYYFYRAIKAEFRKRFKRHKMSDVEKTWASIVGRVGIAARGVVYVVIGISAIRAAWDYDAEKVRTTEEALEFFNNNPTNEIVLGTLGFGFIAYGIHMAFQTKYRSIDPL